MLISKINPWLSRITFTSSIFVPAGFVETEIRLKVILICIDPFNAYVSESLCHGFGCIRFPSKCHSFIYSLDMSYLYG